MSQTLDRPRGNGLTLVHETSGRMRFRLPLLSDPLIDFSWLQTWLESIHGVVSVRINRHARSVIFEHDGTPASRQAIIDLLHALERQKIPSGESNGQAPADLTPIVTSAAAVFSLPFLPPPLRMLVTFLNIGPILVTGLDALLTRGIKVEVLDAIAVGLSASRGMYFTANATAGLMALAGYLEEKTERQSDRMLRRLLRPEPVLAWVERDGALVQVPDNQVSAGE
ncbi:MAG: heavy metal translocating P-type ATPase, partial [Halothiobacillaceae bacterium]